MNIKKLKLLLLKLICAFKRSYKLRILQQRLARFFDIVSAKRFDRS